MRAHPGGQNHLQRRIAQLQLRRLTSLTLRFNFQLVQQPCSKKELVLTLVLNHPQTEFGSSFFYVAPIHSRSKVLFTRILQNILDDL